MSRSAIQAIFAVPDTKTRIGLRNLVLMMLSYGIAARIDEILSLKIIDVHLGAKDPFVILHGKGGRIRSIYLQKLLLEWLERYLKLFHKPTPKPDDFLFYSPWHGTRAKLTQPAISKRLKLYTKIAHERCGEVSLDLHICAVTVWRAIGEKTTSISLKSNLSSYLYYNVGILL